MATPQHSTGHYSACRLCQATRRAIRRRHPGIAGAPLRSHVRGAHAAAQPQPPTVPAVLRTVQERTAQLQAAQAAYWQAIADATAQGLSLRTVAAHSAHTYAALSRRGLASQHTSKG